ncbi:MAG: DUF805 domain-containing protein [Actinomycetota bacterium]|nr:DUF805 domain-containing protein [Actinomycetota bacterium]
MRLVEHYIGGLLKYAEFRGRASRAEYWWFILADAMLMVVFLVLGQASLLIVFFFVVIVPKLSVTVRRLHDTNRSGWWLPLGLIPTPLVFVILFFMCQRGHVEENRYGPPVLDQSASG